MKRRSLGKTGIQTSVLGFGCASYWGMPYYAEKEAFSLVWKAVDKGVNFFDTGHSYSMGNAEPRLGKILKDFSPALRSQLIISTKAGTRNGAGNKTYKDFSPKWIRESLEISLTRLGLEQLPIFHLHGPQVFHFTDEMSYLVESFKKEGKIRAFCINTFTQDVLEFCIQSPIIDCVMLDYNFLRQDRDVLINRFYQAGKGVIGGAALANHVYVNPFKKVRSMRDVWYLLRTLKNHRESMEKAKKYDWINHVDGMTANQIAIAFALANEKISCSVFGTTRIKHLEENLLSCKIKLSDEIRSRLIEE